MRGLSRRRIVGGLFATGAALSVCPGAVFAQSHRPIPRAPMRLTRLLERPLIDGNVVQVRRTWQVDFAEQGRGIAIRGMQTEVRVDAPEALAPLARIEEERSTNDMWPILLSGSGLIREAGRFVREDDLTRAVRRAEEMIAGRAMSAAQQATNRTHLSQISRAGSALLDILPQDLFYPSGRPHRSVRQVNLPDGLTGEFELKYHAVPTSAGGWMESAEREIITRLEGSEERAREEWSLLEV